jgi:non-ribosomal peptide synthetase-like protein
MDLVPAGSAAPTPAADPVLTGYAAVLAEVLQVDTVDPDAHVFEDLGADSMVMARFCARVRKQADLPTVSIKDVYAHPTLRGLATALAGPVPAVAEPSDATPVPAAPARTVRRATGVEYVLCGVMQVLLFLGYMLVNTSILIWAFNWINAGSGLVDYARAVVAGGAMFLAACLLPIAVKWLLIGRWKPVEIPIWTLGYVRFWLVKTLVISNPLVLFAGSPIYNVYLRALGAEVGRGAVVLTRHAPVCTDMLSIGEGTVVRKDTYLNGYRAVAGVIQTGPVSIGRDAFVGDKAVLDIRTSVGDGAQLGHASALHAGQAVPAGQRWHGSPAEPTTSDYQQIEPLPASTWRRANYAVLQLLAAFLVYLPLGFGGIVIAIDTVPALSTLLDPGPLALRTGSFFVAALVLASVLWLGVIVFRFLVIMTVPRLCNLLLEPDRVYPMYGIRYSAHRTVLHLTNSKLFQVLTGDSSYVVHYLLALGYRLKPYVQSGSNFGNEVKHESPYHVSVGRGTVVASGIAFLNADYTSTSFRMSRTALGKDNFLGNDIVYPPQGRTGDNVLLGTKVLVPIDGEVREGVGLLGSPAFEIPRTVARDSVFIRMAHDEDLPRRLAAKNRYNLRTIGWLLLVRWVYAVVFTVVGMTALDVLAELGAWALTLGTLFILAFTLFFAAFVERASTRFRGVQPMYCSIYDPAFWRMERFFKLMAKVGVHRLAVGTPFMGLLWRMVGVRLGKRLYDDGHAMAEKNLVTIGDDVTLNAGSYIQCHSQEDYAFKSDRVTIGSGCTFGVGAMAYYGSSMGDGAVLEADSFLMKGEEVPPGARWGGNPAEELDPGPVSALPAPPAPRTELGTHDDARTGQDTRTVEELMELFHGDDETPAIPVPRRSGRHRATQRHLAGSR